jgi:nucleoside-diphosphate-sugar epimerase
MERLLICGFGDIARRAAPVLGQRFEIRPWGRRFGADLDRPETLSFDAAEALLHCAPPAACGESDARTANLLIALEKGRILPARVVYVSTSGVYGDCAGERVDESRPPAPRTARARRRLDAERQLAAWCMSRGAALVILRAPGIYAADRLPLARLRAGLPLLRAQDDVYTSHIHAEDLAAAVVRALEPQAPSGVYNAADDTEMLMGDWLDLVADRAGLARLPRQARAKLSQVSAFMEESRRLDNRRIKHELGLRLRYPTVHEGLTHADALGVH